MTPDQFAARLLVSGECQVWTGTREKYGYGRFIRDGKVIKTHRYAYELAHGPIPQGMVVMHSCDNPPCCNPDHLRAGTQAENLADMAAKGRARHGRGRTPLTDNDAIAIRKARFHGATCRDLADQYGVSVEAVRSLIRGETFTHLLPHRRQAVPA